MRFDVLLPLCHNGPCGHVDDGWRQGMCCQLDCATLKKSRSCSARHTPPFEQFSKSCDALLMGSLLATAAASFFAADSNTAAANCDH